MYGAGNENAAVLNHWAAVRGPLLGLPDTLGLSTLVVELTSPGMLTRSGWHHDSVKVGDEVTVYLHPSKNGAKLGLFQRVTFADGRPDLIDPRAP